MDTVTVDNGAAVNADCASRSMPNPAGLLAPGGSIIVSGEGGSVNTFENVNGSATSGSSTTLESLSHAKTGQTTQSIALFSVTRVRDTISDGSFEAGLGSGGGTHTLGNGPTTGDGIVAIQLAGGGFVEFGSKTVAEVDAGAGTETLTVDVLSDAPVRTG